MSKNKISQFFFSKTFKHDFKSFEKPCFFSYVNVISIYFNSTLRLNSNFHSVRNLNTNVNWKLKGEW